MHALVVAVVPCMAERSPCPTERGMSYTRRGLWTRFHTVACDVWSSDSNGRAPFRRQSVELSVVLSHSVPGYSTRRRAAAFEGCGGMLGGDGLGNPPLSEPPWVEAHGVQVTNPCSSPKMCFRVDVCAPCLRHELVSRGRFWACERSIADLESRNAAENTLPVSACEGSGEGVSAVEEEKVWRGLQDIGVCTRRTGLHREWCCHCLPAFLSPIPSSSYFCFPHNDLDSWSLK